MAWFTNKTLLKKLKEKQEQGIKVENISIPADPKQATKYSVKFRELKSQTKK